MDQNLQEQMKSRSKKFKLQDKIQMKSHNRSGTDGQKQPLDRTIIPDSNLQNDNIKSNIVPRIAKNNNFIQSDNSQEQSQDMGEPTFLNESPNNDQNMMFNQSQSGLLIEENPNGMTSQDINDFQNDLKHFSDLKKQSAMQTKAKSAFNTQHSQFNSQMSQDAPKVDESQPAPINQIIQMKAQFQTSRRSQKVLTQVTQNNEEQSSLEQITDNVNIPVDANFEPEVPQIFKASAKIITSPNIKKPVIKSNPHSHLNLQEQAPDSLEIVQIPTLPSQSTQKPIQINSEQLNANPQPAQPPEPALTAKPASNAPHAPAKDLLRKLSIYYKQDSKNSNSQFSEDLEGTLSLANFKKTFSTLTFKKAIKTNLNIISTELSLNSEHLIVVMQNCASKLTVRWYHIKTDKCSSNKNKNGEEGGGCKDKFQGEIVVKGGYINAKQVNQNHLSVFNIAFLDSGKFFVLIFDLNGEICRINVNDILGIQECTKSINGSREPLITCCFLTEGTIFVNLYHNSTLKNWYFIYDFLQGQILYEPICIQIKSECEELNFPQNTFFDSKNNMIISLYRQGQILTVDYKNTQKFSIQELEYKDIGQVYFVFDEIIVLNSSNQIIFLRQNSGSRQFDPKTVQWTQYHSIDKMGFIHHTHLADQIQITCDELIYFYKIDRKTLIPQLKSSMYNFPGCSNMMFSPNDMNCITYKSGERVIQIHRKKYKHGFLLKISDRALKGSEGIILKQHDEFMLSQEENIDIFCQESFQLKQSITLPQEDPEKVLKVFAICNCPQDPSLVAILQGYMVGQQRRISNMYIYQKRNTVNWELTFMRKFPKELEHCSQHMVFKKESMWEIMFIDKFKMYWYNYVTEKQGVHMDFKSPTKGAPNLVVYDDDQRGMIVGSNHGIRYISMDGETNVDFDSNYQIEDVRSIAYSPFNKKFYILFNKFEGLLGLYFIEIDESITEDTIPKFLIIKKTKLDIRDADIQLNFQSEDDQPIVVLSFKTIFINTFDIIVVNIKSRKIQFRYEMNHIWEYNVQGLLTKNNDYVIASRKGIRVVGTQILGENYSNPESMTDTQIIQDSKHNELKLHRLCSCSDLIFEPSNFLYFNNINKELIINCCEQYQEEGEETKFEILYKLKISEMGLRDCLISQSIMACKQQTDIVKLIREQPEPIMFFKSFLEFKKCNLVSILAFDSRSIKELLSEQNQKHFNEDFPLFYKVAQPQCGHGFSKYDKPKIQSAINIAIENNQVRGLNLIVLYIVKYQNNFVFNYLFQNCFLLLIEKGLEMRPLLESEIFYYRFDSHLWPDIHDNDCTQIAAYNGSIFNIRQSYHQIFKDLETDKSIHSLFNKFLLKLVNPTIAFNEKVLQRKLNQDTLKKNLEKKILLFFSKEKQIEHTKEHNKKKKLYKIQYMVNLLPSIQDQEGVSLMDACVSTTNLDLFKSQSLEDLIQFKWSSYAKTLHSIGFFIHMAYLSSFSAFVCLKYVYRKQNAEAVMTNLFAVMLFCLTYTFTYDTKQLLSQGIKEYSTDMWNYFDQMHIWIGFFNIYVQWDSYKHQEKLVKDDHEENYLFGMTRIHREKTILVIVTLLMLVKTFFFLRIFSSLSYLVIMIRNVFQDLKVFLIFYVILVWILSLIFQILELGNYHGHADDEMRSIVEEEGYPNNEYHSLPKFLVQFFTVVRYTLANFYFEHVIHLESFENTIFWFVWLVVVLMTCIVFLNFIIAEVSASYTNTMESLHALFLKERTQLIKEAEDMLPQRFHNDNVLFPKYLISRQVEQ